MVMLFKFRKEIVMFSYIKTIIKRSQQVISLKMSNLFDLFSRRQITMQPSLQLSNNFYLWLEETKNMFGLTMANFFQSLRSIQLTDKGNIHRLSMCIEKLQA